MRPGTPHPAVSFQLINRFIEHLLCVNRLARSRGRAKRQTSLQLRLAALTDASSSQGLCRRGGASWGEEGPWGGGAVSGGMVLGPPPLPSSPGSCCRCEISLILHGRPAPVTPKAGLQARVLLRVPDLGSNQHVKDNGPPPPRMLLSLELGPPPCCPHCLRVTWF